MYFNEYKNILIPFSREIGIYSKKEGILLAEAYSRKAGEEVLWDINPELEISQKHLKCKYDIINYSGSCAIPVEVKVRDNSIDKYPTTDITAKKGDYISERSGWLIVIFNDGFDYLVFDLEQYHPPVRQWTHRKTTAIETNEMITEDKYCFDPEKAIYRGKLDKGWLKRGGYGR